MPDTQTWSALLGKWTEFAQASLALPETAEGQRWKDAVTPIITLQACAQALAEVDGLDADERAYGLDKAEILIRQNARSLHTIWQGEPLPAEVSELIDDARRARSAASGKGVEWRVASERLVAPHPGDAAGVLASLAFAGDLLLPTPGVPLFEGSPCAFLRGRLGELPTDEQAGVVEAFLGSCDGEPGEPAVIGAARQVYRQFDFARGGPVRDLVRLMDRDLPPGQPLLMPVIEGGEALPVALPIRGADKVDRLPVEFDPPVFDGEPEAAGDAG
ncbi:MAG: hypothetical protein AAF108_04625 [Planctomycetota bacterium]